MQTPRPPAPEQEAKQEYKYPNDPNHNDQHVAKLSSRQKVSQLEATRRAIQISIDTAAISKLVRVRCWLRQIINNVTIR